MKLVYDGKKIIRTGIREGANVEEELRYTDGVHLFRDYDDPEIVYVRFRGDESTYYADFFTLKPDGWEQPRVSKPLRRDDLPDKTWEKWNGEKFVKCDKLGHEIEG